MTSLDATARAATLGALEQEPFDLVIIGGGITGAGILRDASARGLKVALIEADDFSSGTSSKSTKLIHGGIRYLAQGYVSLVREAALERKRVHRIAPHLAEPTWLTLPARNVAEWLKYKVGVTAYEMLGDVDAADRHFDVSGRSLAEHEPLIDRSRYPRACVYREYLTDDSRLVLANIRAGIEDGGVAVNKLEVTGLVKDGAKVTGVVARCRLSDQEVRVSAKAVINAAGPWVESVARFDGVGTPKPLVLSKGVHVVVAREKLPLSQMVMTVTSDRRPVFMIPRGQVVYIGTTDSRYESEDTWPEVLPEEVDYLLALPRAYCGIELTREDCLTTWAGLRPLISQTGKSTREISRRDEIWVSDSGLVTIAGGKLTGYRKMAEDTVDEACKLIGYRSVTPPAEKPLPGGNFSMSLESLALDLTQTWPMPDARARRLVSLYGAESKDVMAFGDKPIAPESTLVEGEVHWAITREGALSVEDILYRRTRASYYAPAEFDDLVDAVARLAAQTLKWDAAEQGRQAEQAKARFEADGVH